MGLKYPILRELESDRKTVDVFRGYNHNPRIGDGEFFDMKNMTSDSYPILAPRGKRGRYLEGGNIQGMIAKDTLCYVDGSDFVIDGYRVDMNLSTAEEDCPKTLVSMGAYVIILPDKMYLNTEDLTDFGMIEAVVTTNEPVTFTLCNIEGKDYTAQYSQPAEPTGVENMALWVDTSATPHTLKQWSESAGMWVSIATTYIKIASPGIGVPFEKFDGITIGGLKDTVLYDNTTGAEIEDTEQLAALDGTAIVWDKGDDYIVIVGILDITRSVTNMITVSRTMPNMDFVIESGNRLWGCRYGPAANGDVVNEIYASKVGDFKNWSCYMSTAADSYAASVGTDGPFTGAITHLGYPLFFKEGFVHKVYGNFPANYQIQTTACRGVQRGCERSLAIVNEILYYKARSGVCAYDGSLPTEISYHLGNVRYGNAVAGAHGNKYYITMEDEKGEFHLFVYDAVKEMWHREDGLQVDSFCSCRDELYYTDHDNGGIGTMFGSGETDTDEVEWMVETGVLGITSPDMKYISRLTVRLSLEIGAEAEFYAQYDFSDEWVHLFTVEGTSLRSFSIPIRPKRCDHMKLRIVGRGGMKIYSLTKTVEQGSEIS